jgi:hypothetical protein
MTGGFLRPVTSPRTADQHRCLALSAIHQKKVSLKAYKFAAKKLRFKKIVEARAGIEPNRLVQYPRQF